MFSMLVTLFFPLVLSLSSPATSGATTTPTVSAPAPAAAPIRHCPCDIPGKMW